MSWCMFISARLYPSLNGVASIISQSCPIDNILLGREKGRGCEHDLGKKLFHYLFKFAEVDQSLDCAFSLTELLTANK